MSDFNFLMDQISKHWTISAPRRSKRPNISKGTQAPVCPFCPGNEETEVYRIPSQGVVPNPGWDVRVVNNKYPFAPIHEIIIHSPDHHKSFDELPQEQVEKIIHAYKHQFNTYKDRGQVYIFANAGEAAGESILHPHSQLVVIPNEVHLDIPQISLLTGECIDNEFFQLFCPPNASWPDEVWVMPKKRQTLFGDIHEEEIIGLAFVLKRLITILDIRHGQEFPYNLYIYPGKDWYLRIIPRIKILGGFELGTGVMVNTQDPKNTLEFLKIHFQNPDEDLIRGQHMAEYGRSV